MTRDLAHPSLNIKKNYKKKNIKKTTNFLYDEQKFSVSNNHAVGLN